MHHEQHKETWTEFLTDITPNVSSPERVASTIAGGALVAYGLKQGGVVGTLAAILGGDMLFRGATGHCHAYDALGVKTNEAPLSTARSPFNRRPLSGRIHVNKSIMINKSPAELYQFWRDFENLPQFMKHLESVTTTGEKMSHWQAKGPLQSTIEWDAELTSDIENERIGWKSLEGSDIPNSGVVEFRPTANRGTELKVTMIYEAPGGKLGEWAASLFGEEPGLQVAEDLRRFKRLMETGTLVTTEGQPSGREPTRPKSRRAKA